MTVMFLPGSQKLKLKRLFSFKGSKKQKDLLTDSEGKFRRLFETAYDSIVVVNAVGIIEFANARTENFFGYKPQELLNRPIEILIPQCFKENRGFRLLAKRKDGSEFPVEVSLSPFECNTGAVVTVMIRDITDQKRAEDQQEFLSYTSRILSETVDYCERVKRITDITVPKLADMCLVHTFENEKFHLRAHAQRTSIDIHLLEEAFGNECLFAQEKDVGLAYVARSARSELWDFVTDEMLLNMSADETHYKKLKQLNIQSLISVPLLARGHRLGVISFVRCKPMSYTPKDLIFAKLIADRASMSIDNARLYGEAQRAVRIREEVMAMVSHDLKNPLSIIKGFNEIMYNKFSLTSPEIRASTEAINRAAKQMEKLIMDILDFAKIQAGTFSVELNAICVKKLIEDSVELIKHCALKKHIEIKLNLEENLPTVLWDFDRMVQVFTNILGNAIKFTAAGGQVQVCAHLKNSEIEFSVADNGVGIAKENLPHLFDRFWQAQETARQGTGLGLSIVKGIIDSHKGRIWVESTLGIGTTFYFALPVQCH